MASTTSTTCAGSGANDGAGSGARRLAGGGRLLEDTPTYSTADWSCTSETDNVTKNRKVHTWTYDKPLSMTPGGKLSINVIEELDHEYPDCMPEHLWEFFDSL